ncbi:MAG: SDR family oxidoreductase [Gammaproteobacteria bacterium]|nr:SDR family oxidoreductase [Gammaproteobacteria bacterium]
MKNILIIGFGDIGQRLAQRYANINKVSITGLTRSTNTATTASIPGLSVIKADLDQPQSLQHLPFKNAIVFYFAPPPSKGTTDPRLRRFLTAISSTNLPEKIILISTTAVYGHCDGDWVTESTPVEPQTDRGKRRLDAENALQTWSTTMQRDIVILRVAGIYAANRFPIDRLQQQLPILYEHLSPYSNRIHADDLAMICMAAAENAPDGAIYNVCDGQPSTMSHYFKAVAQALGLPAPPEIDLETAQQVMSKGMISYLNESRRISNQKLLDELGITLNYANLNVALAALESQ